MKHGQQILNLSKATMKRKYYNYQEWEEYRKGMWRKVQAHEENEYLKKAIDFTGNHILYGSYMREVLRQWPISCQQNLSNPDINHKAWIGQAACCIAFDCPEYIVRMAWHYLTKNQQDLANEQAELAYKAWIETQVNIVQQSLFGD